MFSDFLTRGASHQSLPKNEDLFVAASIITGMVYAPSAIKLRSGEIRLGIVCRFLFGGCLTRTLSKGSAGDPKEFSLPAPSSTSLTRHIDGLKLLSSILWWLALRICLDMAACCCVWFDDFLFVSLSTVIKHRGCDLFR